MHNEPVHRSIVAVDIEKFGRSDRTDPILVELRRRLDQYLARALGGRLDPSRITWSDTGDGKLCLIDSEHIVRVLEAVDDLDKLVTDYNQTLANERTRLRLRVVVHAGPVVPDEGGWSGHAVIVAFRLLDSPQLREYLAAGPGDLALMVSDQIYEQVISQGHWLGHPPSHFERVIVRNKEMKGRAWALRRVTAPPLLVPSGAGRPQPPPAEEARPGLAGALGRARDTAARLVARVPARLRPLLAVAAALAVALTALTALAVVDRERARGGQVPAARACPTPVPVVLPVLTGPMMESTVRRLAAAFQETERAPCRADVEVFPAASSSEAVNDIAVDWPRDALGRIGPRPAVWLPDSSVEVERVNDKLGRGRERQLTVLGSIATDPVVLAVPRAVRARLRLDRSARWDTILRWARPRPDDPRALRIVRADPASSSAALLATLGLYGTGADPHSVERDLERALGDETVELCDRGQMSGAGGQPPRAVLVSEQALVASNHGTLGGPCGASRPAEPDRLEAIYPADGTPVLDYPYVLLPAASELAARERLARDFYTFLRSPAARQALLQAGFRDEHLHVARTLGEQDGINSALPDAMALPRGSTVTAALGAFDRARLSVSALLAIDVSGSMKEKLQGGTRMRVAQDAVAQAIRLIGDQDQIGLMRFSTRLDGGRDYQELVRLGPASARRGEVERQLRRLAATTGDTGLYDTMLAGIQRLRAVPAGGQDAVKAMIVVTDGQNDDPAGGAAVDDVLTSLDAGEQVLVMLLTFGPVRCETGELRALGDHPDVHCLDADALGLRGAFDRVSAALWGTSRAGGRS